MPVFAYWVTVEASRPLWERIWRAPRYQARRWLSVGKYPFARSSLVFLLVKPIIEVTKSAPEAAPTLRSRGDKILFCGPTTDVAPKSQPGWGEHMFFFPLLPFLFPILKSNLMNDTSVGVIVIRFGGCVMFVLKSGCSFWRVLCFLHKFVNHFGGCNENHTIFYVWPTSAYQFTVEMRLAWRR